MSKHEVEGAVGKLLEQEPPDPGQIDFGDEEELHTLEVPGPNWEYAVRIYIGVLQNPDAPAATKIGAEEDLLRLGRAMDEIQARD